MEPAALGRSSGVLLHVTSLPDGRIGDDARRFVDWLHAAGQRWWQVLPVGPPGPHRSPYSSPSAFAASPALLSRPDAPVAAHELEAFVAEHPYWCGDWAAFAGRVRAPSDAGPRRAVADQVRFAREWAVVRTHATERGIRILGDAPIYVAAGGADVAARPHLFRTDEVAGVPPDDWSADGQRWGNPLYDWVAMRSEGYRWWIERFRRMLELFDAVRIDHFRGFVAYWAVPAHLGTARRGRWRRGPGADLFRAVQRTLGGFPVVAEDLGVITPAVERLRDDLGMPGNVVMQFEFADDLVNRPPTVRTDHVVSYTGTHDNDTTVGWWRTLSPGARARVDRALDELGLDEPRPHWKLIRLSAHSRARVAIVPAQDLLGLGSSARMNRPGRATGSWRWRLASGQLDVRLAAELRELTEATGRTQPALPGGSRAIRPAAPSRGSRPGRSSR